MENKIHNITRSSKGDGSLALTVRGILVGLIPLFISVGEMFNVEITTQDATQIIQAFTALLSAGMVLYGVVRKIYVRVR